MIDAADDFCLTKCRREDRLGRNEEDVQRIYSKLDKMLWATLSSAGASILCLIGIVASILTGR